ncbi:MAG: 50S ribosomal protein L15, partial [Demequina sp.]
KSSTAKSSTSKATAAKKPATTKAAASTSADSTSTAATKPAASKSTAAKKPGTNGSDPGEKVSTLRMHHLRPAEGAHMRKMRVGRGEAGRRGKTAGRGTKGTGARYQVPQRFEGGQTPIHMRIPKLRGFRSPFKVVYQVVNLDQIEKLYPKGGKVTKEDLVTKGAVRKNRPVKVLGEGDLNVKITVVDADRISQSAKTKIEAAGGSVNVN